MGEEGREWKWSSFGEMGISSAVARRYEWIVSSNEFGHSDGFPGECNCGFVGDWDPSLTGFVGGEDNISRNEGC